MPLIRVPGLSFYAPIGVQDRRGRLYFWRKGEQQG